MNKTEFNIAHMRASACVGVAPHFLPRLKRDDFSGELVAAVRRLAHPRLPDWHMKIKTRRYFVVFDPRAVTMLVQLADRCVCEKQLLF